jgi:hypothetical protein
VRSDRRRKKKIKRIVYLVYSVSPLPLIYGEGRKSAIDRLQREIRNSKLHLSGKTLAVPYSHWLISMELGTEALRIISFLISIFAVLTHLIHGSHPSKVSQSGQNISQSLGETIMIIISILITD